MIRAPLIWERTKDGEAMYDVFSRLVKDRIVFLEDIIDTEMATTIAATLLFLDNQSHNKPISLYINSPGGYVHSGLFTIYDTMNYIQAPVKTVCIGEAYSAAAVILAAGQPGMRMALPNSYIMIHEISGGMKGSTTEIVKHADRIKQGNERLVELLAKHSKNSVAKMKKLIKEETYFTAEEAKKLGIIDEVSSPNSFDKDTKLSKPLSKMK